LTPPFFLEVVPDGFGVAYMTGYDGDFFTPNFSYSIVEENMARSSAIHGNVPQGNAKRQVYAGNFTGS